MSFKEITLDLNRLQTKAEAHKYLRQVLNLPNYYGENLDALYDCLGDMDSPIIINIPKAVADDKHLGSYGETLLKVLRLAAEENAYLKVKFI